MERSVGQERKGSAGRGAPALALLAALLSPAATSAQTRPGTPIVNVAAAREGEAEVASNSVALSVAERLDLALTRVTAADATLASGERALGVTLTNTGTGDEAFALTLAGAAARIVPATDAALPATDRTAVLAPGEALPLLLIFPAGVTGTATLTARALTGSGAPGTALPGLGDGGSDAVTGPSGAAATLAVTLAAAAATPTLEKSQAVVAPDGSATPVSGAVVTYTLVARFAAASAAADLIDPVPAGTAYRPGSLVLDGVPLADAGHLVADAGGAVRVAVPLGAIAAGAVRTLRFQVVIS